MSGLRLVTSPLYQEPGSFAPPLLTSPLRSRHRPTRDNLLPSSQISPGSRGPGGLSACSGSSLGQPAREREWRLVLLARTLEAQLWNQSLGTCGGRVTHGQLAGPGTICPVFEADGCLARAEEEAGSLARHLWEPLWALASPHGASASPGAGQAGVAVSLAERGSWSGERRHGCCVGSEVLFYSSGPRRRLGTHSVGWRLHPSPQEALLPGLWTTPASPKLR